MGKKYLQYKILFLAAVCFVFFAAAQNASAVTEVVHTIKPSGQGGDYTTLAAWEAGEQGDLTGVRDEIAVAQIDGDWSTPDTTAVTISSWTTNATHYIKIYTTAQARHNGEWDTNRYRLSVANSRALYINEEYVRVSGIQVEANAGSANFQDAIGVENIAAGGSEIQIDSSIARTHTNSAFTSRAIILNDADIVTFKMWNVVAQHRGGTASNDQAIYFNAQNVYLGNITASGGRHGIRQASTAAGTTRYRNCLATNSSVADFLFAVGPTYDIDYNASEDATADDQGLANNHTSHTFSFVNSANTDFHLTSADVGAKNIGVSMASDANIPYSTDVDGQTRSGDWDIGADEYTGTIINSPNLPGGSKMKINMSLTDKMTNGLVGMWSFDGANMDWSQTTAEARDTSGNNNHGDVVGATVAVGKRGQALSFNGTTDYVRITDDSEIEGLTNFSVSAWVKSAIPNKAVGENYIMHDHNSSSFDLTWTQGEDIDFQIYNNAGANNYARYADGILDTNWHHIVGVYNGTDIRVYVDNVLGGTVGNWSDPVRTSVSTLDISSSLAPWNGKMDEVRIYSRALSVGEVADLYRMGQAKIKR